MGKTSIFSLKTKVSPIFVAIAAKPSKSSMQDDFDMRKV